MGESNWFAEAFRYLQDPHLVARFQRICGVRGTFSETVCAGSTTGGSGKGADRTRSHNNGSCHHHITGENESENLAVLGGAGEGEKVATAAGVRKRFAESNVKRNHGEESECGPQNGAVASAATAAGETVAASLPGATAAGQGGSSAAGPDFSEATALEEKRSENGPPSSTVKPLRRNSLTGDAGQEFLIENRLLYYLFTFGTELGNESFYITFFPFLIWNLDAFVGRRLIMVWVWVMYLGQCTKDVIGWPRPASPPVVKVEMFYNSEYSMPSTHAMSGSAIPFSLFFMTCGRWERRVSPARLLTVLSAERSATVDGRGDVLYLRPVPKAAPVTSLTSSAGAESEGAAGRHESCRPGPRRPALPTSVSMALLCFHHVPARTGLQSGSLLVSAGLRQSNLHGDALSPGRDGRRPVQRPDPAFLPPSLGPD
ncbi:uncharacterized protein sgpp1 isoform X3 [Xiphias gladius]|uniref:uncharacterized protein sgpp1 isoform X3 n=1 Tax=Xiphias gladius TaxID=8245 RepID=UPI001A9904E3|nr:uncharacterized protein sgpp1 isoform X3 [Xiphias gladius]